MLSFWCFCAGLLIAELKALGARTVALASGTLAPLAPLAQELLVPFRVRLENAHVIDPRLQLYAAVVARGPSGRELKATYENRNTDEYKGELGALVANVRARRARGTGGRARRRLLRLTLSESRRAREQKSERTRARESERARERKSERGRIS